MGAMRPATGRQRMGGNRMATNGTKDLSQQEQASLQDSEIATAKVNRRSFLARAMGASTLAVGAALTVACGNQTDACDTDIGDVVGNVDTGAGADSGDSCDTD